MINMKYAPIVLFVYKRPAETLKVLEALVANPEAAQSELFVYADGPKNEADKEKCLEVRNLVKNYHGFGKITLYASDTNKGLANSIISGVSEILEKFDRVIVLEDDLVTSKYFLRFMNEALDKFEANDDICSIHAFSYPPVCIDIQYFLRRGADCWGWATWKRSWRLFSPDAKKLHKEIVTRKLSKLFDRNGAFPYTKMLKDQADGKIDSWAIRWYASAFLAEKYTLQSNVMLVENIGFGRESTHCSSIKQKYKITLSDKPIVWEHLPMEESLESLKMYRRYLKMDNVPFFAKCFIKLKKIIKCLLFRK